MSKKIFNRKDAEVVKDAQSLTETDFINKYVESTTANETVLKSVYKQINKGKAVETQINDAADVATDFVEPTATVEVEAEEEVETDLKAFQKKAANVAKKEKKEAVKEEKKVEVKEGSSKPGRTPRMRELIKEHGKDVDKQKIKRLLEEEGYDTSGSGLHSEWNRVSKAK